MKLDEFKTNLGDASKLLVYGPDGSIGFIPRENQDDAELKGYRLATPDEAQKEMDRKEYGESLGDQLLAGGLGVARGISAKLSDVIIPAVVQGQTLMAGNESIMGGALSSAMGSPEIGAKQIALGQELQQQAPAIGAQTAESIRGLKSANPTTSTVGEVAGIGAGVMAGGITPTGLIAGAGRGVENKILQKLGTEAAEGLLKRAGGKLIAGGAAGALEGGLWGAGEYASQLSLERDKDFSTEALMAHMGSGAAIGGLVGGGLSGGLELLPSLKPALDSVSSSVSKRAKDLYNSLAALRTGRAAEEIAPLWEPLAFMPQSIKPSPEVIKDFASKLGISADAASDALAKKEGTAIVGDILGTSENETNQLLRAANKLSSEQRQSITDKVARGYENVGNDVSNYLNNFKRFYEQGEIGWDIISANGAKELNSTVADQIDKIAVGLAEKPYVYKNAADYTNWAKDFVNKVEDFNKVSSNDAPKLYKFLIDEKGNLNGIMRNTPAGATLDKMAEASGVLEQALTNKAVWGDNITNITNIRNAYEDYLNNLNAIKQTFQGHRMKGELGATTELKLDANKLNSFLKNPDAHPAEAKLLQKFEDSSDRLSNLIEKTPVIENLTGRERLQLGLETNKFLLDLLERNRLFSELSRSDKISMLDLIGAGVGGLTNGIPGGAIGFAGMRIARNLGVAPAKDIALLRGFQNIIDRPGKIITGSIKKLNEIPRGAFLPLTATNLTQKEMAERDKLKAQLETLSSRPGQLDANLNKSLAGLSELSPILDQTAREKLKVAAQFLQEKMPKTTQLDPMRPSVILPPSQLDVAKFNRYLATVNNPLIVFKDLSQGQIYPEGIETLQRVYPAIYQKFLEKAIDTFNDSNTKYETRLLLRTALGLSEGDTARAQSVYKANEEKQSPKNLGESDIKRLIKSEGSQLQGVITK